MGSGGQQASRSKNAGLVPASDSRCILFASGVRHTLYQGSLHAQA